MSEYKNYADPVPRKGLGARVADIPKATRFVVVFLCVALCIAGVGLLIAHVQTPVNSNGQKGVHIPASLVGSWVYASSTSDAKTTSGLDGLTIDISEDGAFSVKSDGSVIMSGSCDVLQDNSYVLTAVKRKPSAPVLANRVAFRAGDASMLEIFDADTGKVMHMFSRAG